MLVYLGEEKKKRGPGNYVVQFKNNLENMAKTDEDPLQFSTHITRYNLKRDKHNI